MNTPSHFLLHLGIRKFFRSKYDIYISKSFVLWAIAPDVGLYICVLVYTMYAHFFLWYEMSVVFKTMFDDLYFNNPVWIFAYNFLHSIFLLILFLLISWYIKHFINQRIWIICIWFFIACLLHSAIDIVTHQDDGPRIFYPLSLYQFQSPISYWNPLYYWGIVSKIEFVCDILLMWYLLYSPIKNKIIWQKNTKIL